MSNKAQSMAKPVMHLETSSPLRPNERQRLKYECRLKYGDLFTIILHEPSKAQHDEYLKEVLRRYEEGRQSGNKSVELLNECFKTTPLKRTAKRLI